MNRRELQRLRARLVRLERRIAHRREQARGLGEAIARLVEEMAAVNLELALGSERPHHASD